MYIDRAHIWFLMVFVCIRFFIKNFNKFVTSWFFQDFIFNIALGNPHVTADVNTQISGSD